MPPESFGMGLFLFHLEPNVFMLTFVVLQDSSGTYFAGQAVNLLKTFGLFLCPYDNGGCLYVR